MEEKRSRAVDELKIYLRKIVRSPLTIIGLVLSLLHVFISIFPELISGYTFAETIALYPGAWQPPSLEHLFGTARFGRDVLALTVYGIQDAIIFGYKALRIGLVGGLVFGLLASKFKQKVHTIITVATLAFYFFPGMLIGQILASGTEPEYEILVLTTGVLLIPSFTRAIGNTEFSVISIGKKAIAFLPLFAGIAIMLYILLGILRLVDPITIQLGDLLNEVRTYLFTAPWATFWPGFSINFILIGLFVLHKGLAKCCR